MESGNDLKPKGAYAWNLEMAASIVFQTKEEAEDFRKLYETNKYPWTDPIEGEKVLRVTRDASFDQRLWNQVYFHVRGGLKRLLVEKGKWDESVSELGSTGPRGVVFLKAGSGITRLMQVDVSKRGVGVL